MTREMHPYTPEELEEVMVELPDWLSTDFAIHRSYTFPSFRTAIAFINHVANIAEEHNHYPDIEINFRDVSLSLWTPTQSAVTPLDIKLAKAIDAVPI